MRMTLGRIKSGLKCYEERLESDYKSSDNGEKKLIIYCLILRFAAKFLRVNMNTRLAKKVSR